MSCKRRRGRERRSPLIPLEWNNPTSAGRPARRFRVSFSPILPAPPPSPTPLSLCPRVSCPIFHGGNPTTVARARSITWRRLRGQQRAYRRRRLSRFRSLQFAPSLCVIFARAAVWSTTRCCREGGGRGAICLTIVQLSFSRPLSYPWDSVTWLDYRDYFLFIYFSSKNCASLSCAHHFVTMGERESRGLRVNVNSGRKRKAFAILCLSILLFAHSFAPLWGLYDWLHTHTCFCALLLDY